MLFVLNSMVTTQPKQPLATAFSLQTVTSSRKQQLMLSDSKGILCPHHIRPDTVQQIQAIVAAEERMDALTASAQPSLMPSTSLGSVPSTSSLHSSTASVASQQSQDRYFASFPQGAIIS